MFANFSSEQKKTTNNEFKQNNLKIKRHYIYLKSLTDWLTN